MIDYHQRFREDESKRGRTFFVTNNAVEGYNNRLCWKQDNQHLPLQLWVERVVQEIKFQMDKNNLIYRGKWRPEQHKVAQPFDRVENLLSGKESEYYSDSAPLKKTATLKMQLFQVFEDDWDKFVGNSGGVSGVEPEEDEH